MSAKICKYTNRINCLCNKCVIEHAEYYLSISFNYFSEWKCPRTKDCYFDKCALCKKMFEFIDEEKKPI